MGKNQKPEKTNRRDFFSLLFSKNDSPDKIKMLTADGKLVEVDRSVLEAASQQKKTVSNKEILKWMKNPSKNDLDPSTNI